jgi:hypothetical protein
MRHVATTMLLASLVVPAALADDLEDRAAASRAASTELLMALKSEVEKAIQAGGPMYAVSVCNEKAPQVTRQLSADVGFDVARTSLKYRNPKNAPDAWERRVLEQFAKRKAAGEDLKTLEYYEVVEQDGQQVFRYMKAIPLGGVCVNCHGPKINAKLSEKIYSLYPEDKARGFIPGDLRGAFTVTQPM